MTRILAATVAGGVAIAWAALAAGPAAADDTPPVAEVTVAATDHTPPYPGALCLRVPARLAVDLSPAGPAGGARRAWILRGTLSGIAVQDTRPGQAGWTLTGFATAADLGWSPQLVSTGSDAEGNPKAGAPVDPALKTPGSGGLGSPGHVLAAAAQGNGLGTERVAAAVEVWLPDPAVPADLSAILTLTLVSP